MAGKRAGSGNGRRKAEPGRAGAFALAGALLVAAAGCGQRAADGSPDPDLVPEWSALSATLLVPRGSAWRYLDDGSDQGTAWRATTFVDTAWKMGAAQLGYFDRRQVRRSDLRDDVAAQADLDRHFRRPPVSAADLNNPHLFHLALVCRFVASA